MSTAQLSKNLVSIGHAAKQLKVSIFSLRRWEKRGLITPHRSPGGTRYYDLNELKKIKASVSGRLRVNKLVEVINSNKLNDIKPAPTSNSIEKFIKPFDVNSLKEIYQLHKNPPTPLPPSPFKLVAHRPSLITNLLLLSLAAMVVTTLKVAGLALPNKTHKQLASTNTRSSVSQPLTQGEVLAATSIRPGLLTINSNTDITGKLQVQGDIVVTGRAVEGLIQSIKAGENIEIDATDKANPTVSLAIPSLVSTIGKTSGDITLGTGLTISSDKKLSVNSTISEIRSNGGCSGCITNADASDDLTISSSGSVAVGALSGTLTIAKGGTGLTGYAAGDIIYASAADTLSKLSAGTNGYVLTLSSGVPIWAAATVGVSSLNSLTGALTIAAGGINAISASGTTVTVTATEADTLAAVTSRGATTSTALTLSSSSNEITVGTLTASGGTINGVAIGGTSASTGAFTTLTTSSTINSNTFSSTALTFAGASPAISAATAGTSISLDAATTGKMLIGGTSTGDIDIAGGSGAAGCTINNATGDLTCTGTLSSSGGSSVGYWQRSVTTLSPATSGDAITTSGNISTTGSGTLSVAGTATFSSTINTNTFTATGLVFGEATPVITGTTSINVNTTGGTGSVLLGGGSASTGCTINDSTGDLTCAGTIASSGGSSVGYWQRSVTTLSPATSGDAITTSGAISATGAGGTVSAGALMTAQDGLTLSTGALSLTSTSGSATLTLSSSATAFNVNSGVFDIDTQNSRVGIGTISPDGSLEIAYNSAASTPGELLSGTWFTGGTATTTKPHLLIEPAGTTSSAWSTSGTGLGINAVSTFAGSLIDIQQAASSVFKVSGASSGVNGFTFTTTATTVTPAFAVTGSDTNIGLNINSKGTGAITLDSANVSGTTTSSAFVFNGSALTSGTGIYATSATLTTGNLVDINTGSANLFSTGNLLNIASTSTALTSGNFLNISNGSSIFSVSNTSLTTSLPLNETAPGDVAIAYDLNFTNPTASYIKSSAPLYLQSGELFNSSDLNLQTYNLGTVVMSQANATTTTSGTSYAVSLLPTLTSATNSLAHTWYSLYNLPTVNESGTGVGVTTLYGSYTGFTNTAGTTTTWYANYIAAPTGSGTTTNKYALVTESGAGNVGIGDTTPDALLDLDSTSTSGGDFLITNTGISASGTIAGVTANSATIGDILTLSATALTTGSVFLATGPSSTGVTDHFAKLTSDIGSGASLLNLNPDFSGAGVTGYGVYNVATDSTTSANTDYGYYGSLALTGNAAKTGYGLYQTVTSTSTTADTLYGADILVDHNAAGTSGNKTLYGIRSQVTNDGITDASTGAHNIYAGYFAATGNIGDTAVTYGLYVDADSGDTSYGLYIADGSGTTDYGIYQAGSTDDNYFAGNISIGTDTSPDNLLDLTSSATSADVVTISATSLSTGTAINITGPSAGTAGVTDAALKITSDVGNIGTSNGLINSTATFDDSTLLGNRVNLYLSSTHNPGGSGVGFGYGIYNKLVDSSTTQGNANYGTYQDVSNSANYPKTLYGEYVSITNTAVSSNNTDTTYGIYITSNVSHGADTGTVNQYGIYLDDGTSSLNGASKKIALYLEPQTGADANYGICFDCDGTFGTQTVATGIQWGTDSTTANNIALYRSADGTTTLELGDGTDLIAASAADFQINLGAQVGATAQRLCHNGADAATGAQSIGDCVVTDQADLAEFYDTDGDLEPGDVVSPKESNYKVTPTKQTYEKGMIGVVSTNPIADGIMGFNVTSSTRQPIGLAGRVPVKVSLENGSIKVGDSLTSSSIPGVTMKATRPGRVIGKALEDYDGTTRVSPSVILEEDRRGLVHPDDLGPYHSDPTKWAEGVGKIMVFVNPAFADPNDILANLRLDESGNLVTNHGVTSASLSVTPDTEKIATPPVSLESRFKDLESRVLALEAFSIASSSANIASSSAFVSLDASSLVSEASLSAKLTAYEGIFQGVLKSLGETFLGNTTIAGSLSVDGTLAVSENSINVIGITGSTSGILYLQSSPLARGLDIFNGSVTIDKLGNLATAGRITASKYTVNTSDPDNLTLGSNSIPAGQLSVEIHSLAVTTNSKVFITPTSPTGKQSLIVADKTPGRSFIVTIEDPYSKDITFDWWIVDSK